MSSPVGNSSLPRSYVHGAMYTVHSRDVSLSTNIKYILNDIIFCSVVFQIQLGTLDQKDVDIEWKLKPYMNTAKKRQTLSDNNQ